jgi:hypothetical protein
MENSEVKKNNKKVTANLQKFPWQNLMYVNKNSILSIPFYILIMKMLL